VGWVESAFANPVTGRVIEAVVIALVIAGLIALSRWVRNIVKTRTDLERERNADLRRLLQYHEGSPGDPSMGVDPTPGIQARFDTLEKQVTPNGGDTNSLGDRVQRTEQLALAAVRQNEVVMELLLAHLNDGKSVMEIGVANDKNLWDYLRSKDDLQDLPEYIDPPEDVVFGLEDLERRRDADNQGDTDG
jgi:hypothetical protein